MQTSYIVEMCFIATKYCITKKSGVEEAGASLWRVADISWWYFLLFL